jgi:hypothetical protein
LAVCRFMPAGSAWADEFRCSLDLAILCLIFVTMLTALSPSLDPTCLPVNPS